MTSVEVWSDIHVRCHSESETRKVMLSLDLVQNPLDNKLKIKYFEWNETSFFACHCRLHWLHRYCLSHHNYIWLTVVSVWSQVFSLLAWTHRWSDLWPPVVSGLRPRPLVSPAQRVRSDWHEDTGPRPRINSPRLSVSPSIPVSQNIQITHHTYSES